MQAESLRYITKRALFFAETGHVAYYLIVSNGGYIAGTPISTLLPRTRSIAMVWLHTWCLLK